jgi:oligopeptide/dipeptide ABC transporter ATP-binding protein
VAKLILWLEQPTSGRVAFCGEDVHRMEGEALRSYRASVQAVFQDPWSSLNPRMRIQNIVAEPLTLDRHLRAADRRARVGDLLQAVGLPSTVASSFPHELSGGMRQRVAIARALASRPSLVVLDEPVSALDVSIRAQIINLLRDLQAQFHTAYLFIAHDLAAVRHLSHQVAVMYLGQIVELGPAEAVFPDPWHPYTKALIAASVLAPVEASLEPIFLNDEVPSPANPPSGCRFHPRCPFAFDRCSREAPPLRELAPGRKVACHLY